MLEELKRAAVNIYRGCAPDMGEHDLEDAVFFVADRLHDEFGPGNNYLKIAEEALRPYFSEE